MLFVSKFFIADNALETNRATTVAVAIVTLAFLENKHLLWRLEPPQMSSKYVSLSLFMFELNQASLTLVRWGTCAHMRI